MSFATIDGKRHRIVPVRRAMKKSTRNRAGILVDAPCQAPNTNVSHVFIPWDMNPKYSRCFCGLMNGPRGGLYLLPSPVEKIEAEPATVWEASELPELKPRTNRQTHKGDKIA